MARSVSLVKNVSYENQKIEDVEKRIDYKETPSAIL